MLSSIVLLLSVTLAFGCQPTSPPPPNPPPNPAPPSTGQVTNVLWLGNAYTGMHELPKMVQELARYEGKSISYDTHTKGGWTLQKHANSAVIILKLVGIAILKLLFQIASFISLRKISIFQTTSNLIRSRRWDVVIMQEQSQLPLFGEAQVCEMTVASLKNLVNNVRASSPSARIQVN